MSNVDEVSDMDDTMIDAKAIIKVLGISPSMWSKLKQKGLVKPPVKFGSSSRWKKSYILGLRETGVSLSKAS